MTYQQNRGPPKQIFCSRCAEWGVPGREIYFKVEGTKLDGSPKNIPHDINTNNRHQHQFFQSGLKHWGYKHPQSGEFVNLDSQYGMLQQPEPPAQRPHPPDAPRSQGTQQAQYVPPTSQLGARTFTRECDKCRENGVPGQYIFGYLVAHDTVRNVDTWNIYDHDMSNPQAGHSIKHQHRTLPSNTTQTNGQQSLTNTQGSVNSILPNTPASQGGVIIPNVSGNVNLRDEFEMWAKSEGEKNDKVRELRRQELEAMKEHAYHMEENSKNIQKILLALIRVQIITTDRIEAAIKANFRAAMLAEPKKLEVFERECIKQLTSERFWVKDPLIFNALSQFEKAEFAEPTPVVKEKAPPKPVPEKEKSNTEMIVEEAQMEEGIGYDDYGAGESFQV